MIRFIKGMLCDNGLIKHVYSKVVYDTVYGIHFQTCECCKRIWYTNKDGIRIREL